LDNEGYPASKPPWGTLNCLDLLFCSGTRDSKIRAFDKETGAELWSGNLPWVGSAPPTTYSINGRQFVVVASTGNKLGQQIEYGDAYVAFALPETK
jgi:quinoprotein glucose dehydrogenase